MTAEEFVKAVKDLYLDHFTCDPDENCGRCTGIKDLGNLIAKFEHQKEEKKQ